MSIYMGVLAMNPWGYEKVSDIKPGMQSRTMLFGLMIGFPIAALIYAFLMR
jgi:hypothetical protein